MPKDPDRLDDLLSAYAKQRPAAPEDNRFTAEVWSKIETRRRPFGLGSLVGLSWIELFRQPRLAFAALAAAVFTAIIPAALERPEQRRELARASLHFEVFSPENSSVLPSAERLAHK